MKKNNNKQLQERANTHQYFIQDHSYRPDMVVQQTNNRQGSIVAAAAAAVVRAVTEAELKLKLKRKKIVTKLLTPRYLAYLPAMLPLTLSLLFFF